MMEAVCTSETSVHSGDTTWHYIPEDSKLRTHHVRTSNLLIISGFQKSSHRTTSLVIIVVDFLVLSKMGMVYNHHATCNVV
jgi:hypothetical protein